MKLPISNRLRVCCGFVAPGDRVADIGCDHGYLSIYLLKKAEIPGVLIECGFLSNQEEEELLLSDEYREKVSIAIYKGIMELLS